jgi:putative nucleotidyltransferase with HDIG domain
MAPRDPAHPAAQRFCDFLNQLSQDLADGNISFPTFAEATLKIRDALNDPDLDVGRLSRIINSEPLLPAKLVRAANSVAFNPAGAPIADVRSAVIRLGHNVVRSIALAVSLEQLQSAAEFQSVRSRAEQVWRHSITVAAVAQVVAQRMTTLNAEEALFAGVVHDIGKFYLLSRAARYAELINDDAELDELLLDWHASIGHAVLQTLDVPDDVSSAVNEHELGGYVMPPQTLADVVVIANHVAHALDGTLGDEGRALVAEPAIAALLKDRKGEIDALVRALRN